ncbi:PTS transporter subunit EIIC [Terribacillus saccharophilus]|uniref:PTS transporter subunit EIIC n=1 Tax=Terribacillus saccharophilus TaxID=361277 RepID=UPI002DC58689|nr:PTS transporter subunit EIIC [Terribacillus saccharophilus]
MKNIFSFDFFQRVGKTFMVVISLLPAAGLLLGIGTTLQSPYFIEYFPFLESGGWQTFGELMRGAGSVIFSNLGISYSPSELQEAGQAEKQLLVYRLLLGTLLCTRLSESW